MFMNSWSGHHFNTSPSALRNKPVPILATQQNKSTLQGSCIVEISSLNFRPIHLEKLQSDFFRPDQSASFGGKEVGAGPQFGCDKTGSHSRLVNVGSHSVNVMRVLSDLDDVSLFKWKQRNINGTTDSCPLLNAFKESSVKYHGALQLGVGW